MGRFKTCIFKRNSSQLQATDSRLRVHVSLLASIFFASVLSLVSKHSSSPHSEKDQMLEGKSPESSCKNNLGDEECECPHDERLSKFAHFKQVVNGE